MLTLYLHQAHFLEAYSLAEISDVGPSYVSRRLLRILSIRSQDMNSGRDHQDLISRAVQKYFEHNLFRFA